MIDTDFYYAHDHMIMCITFVNRKREFEFLNDRFETNSRQLIVLYGRRRVGKTTLVTEFLERNCYDHVYFLADQRGTDTNARRFAEQCATAFDDVPPAVEGFDDVFEYIVRRVDDTYVVVIDEFSYLVEKDESIPSVFQLIHDEILSGTDISVILLGSSISMMEEGALSHKSPLYGRRTGQWKLSPLGFSDTCCFFPSYSITDLIRVYAVLGGVPAYLEQFDPGESVADNIYHHVLLKGTFLYEEPRLFLRQELREPATYTAILEAIAAGNTKVTEIANAIGRNAGGISRYLKNLQQLEVIDKSVPVTASNRKRGIYTITDHFFEFWFRFVFPNSSDLEQGNTKSVVSSVMDELDEYTSYVFEDVCRQAVQHPDFPVSVSRTGTWWYNELEIDVAAVCEEDKRLVLGECKWTNSSIGSDLFATLEQTASNVRWRGTDRTEYFVLFSKSGFTDTIRETAAERDDLFLYDLQELASLFDVATDTK